MPTPKQEKLAEAIILNASADKPRNKTQLLESAGYSPVSAMASAKVIMEQEGVREALAARGFSVANADNVVANILTDDDEQAKDRLKAAELVYKRHPGALQPEAPLAPAQQINFFISNPKAKQAVQDFESAIIDQLYAEEIKETPSPLATDQGDSKP